MHAPRSAYPTGSPRSRSIPRRLVSAAFAATVTALVAGTTVGAAAVPQGVAPPPPGPVGVVRPTTTVPPKPPGPVGVPTSTTLVAPPTRPTVAETVPPTVMETLAAPVSSDAAPESSSPPPPAPPPPPATEAPQPPSTDAQFDLAADAACVWTAVDDYYTITAGEVLEPAGPQAVRLNDDTQCDPPVSSFGMRVVADVNHGTLEFFFADFAYTPDGSYTGPDTFTYEYYSTETSPDTILATATVHITVSDCSAIANMDLYQAEMGTPVVPVAAPGMLANDVVTCTPITIESDQPAHGSVVIHDDGGFEYSPDPTFEGLDEFDYELHDSSDVIVATGTVFVVITGPDCVAVDDSYTVVMDNELEVLAPGVLANDVVCLGLTENVLIDDLGLLAPTHGTLSSDHHGGFQYIPDPGYVGADTFEYRLQWLVPWFGSEFDVALVTIEVIAPCSTTLVDDAYEVAPNTELHVAAPGPGANDTVCPGHHLQVADVPSHGTVALAGDGDMTYVPAPDFVGTDTFTYTMVGGPAELAGFRSSQIPDARTAAVTITVTETPSPTTTTLAAPTTTAPPSGELPRTGAGPNGLVVAIAAAAIAVGCIFWVAFRRTA